LALRKNGALDMQSAFKLPIDLPTFEEFIATTSWNYLELSERFGRDGSTPAARPYPSRCFPLSAVGNRRSLAFGDSFLFRIVDLPPWLGIYSAKNPFKVLVVCRCSNLGYGIPSGFELGVPTPPYSAKEVMRRRPRSGGFQPPTVETGRELT